MPSPDKSHQDDPRFLITLVEAGLLKRTISIKPDEFHFKSSAQNPLDVRENLQAAAPAA